MGRNFESHKFVATKILIDAQKKITLFIVFWFIVIWLKLVDFKLV